MKFEYDDHYRVYDEQGVIGVAYDLDSALVMIKLICDTLPDCQWYIVYRGEVMACRDPDPFITADTQQNMRLQHIRQNNQRVLSRMQNPLDTLNVITQQQTWFPPRRINKVKSTPPPSDKSSSNVVSMSQWRNRDA